MCKLEQENPTLCQKRWKNYTEVITSGIHYTHTSSRAGANSMQSFRGFLGRWQLGPKQSITNFAKLNFYLHSWYKGTNIRGPEVPTSFQYKHIIFFRISNYWCARMQKLIRKLNFLKLIKVGFFPNFSWFCLSIRKCCKYFANFCSSNF